jgi:hypothetical protein
MAYGVRPHPPDVAEQIAALPGAARAELDRVLADVAEAPWRPPSVQGDNPGGAVRVQAFGPDLLGMVVYLVLERERQVQIELVLWTS